MSTLRNSNYRHWLVVLALVGLAGCTQPGGGGGGGDGDGGGNGGIGGLGGGTDGGGASGGFEDNGLTAPGALPAGTENIPPTGDLLYPPADAVVAVGDVIFLWEAADANETNLDSTVYVGEQADVFDNPLVTQGVRTPPEETEHRLAVQLPDTGSLYWGVEITDGVNTIRRPADEEGVPFEVSDTGGGRVGLQDAILLCPGSAMPARQVTTFKWSPGEVTPVRTQVFVSRADQDNPFESPLRVYNVDPPTATSLPLADDDPLPLGEELSWGLRIETADEVLFTFDGQLGESFLVAENVPPSGALLGPANDSVLPDGAVLDLVWEDSAGNCEDEMTLTIALEYLGDATEPTALFESDIQLTAAADSVEAELFPQLMELDLQSGRWAWGILADDGTDQATLPDDEDPEKNFRTFIRDTSPAFVAGPDVAVRTCGTADTGDAIVFEYEDDNGTDSVDVTLFYALTEDEVFDEPAATLALTPGGAGEETVVFIAGGITGCPSLAEGTGYYGVQLDDGVNDPVQETVAYAGKPTGACCAPDGSCTDGTETECTAGTYAGDGTSCASVECVPPEGACCLPDGSCTDGPEADCTDGEYQGNGTTCDTVECEAFIGACCAPDGTCTEGTAAQCTEGEYQGNGTACAEIECPVEEIGIGACCEHGGGCSEGFATLCLGEYMGDGTTCATVDCGSALIDCNNNGIADADDIADGFSRDCNLNSVPDECEGTLTTEIAGANTVCPASIGNTASVVNAGAGTSYVWTVTGGIITGGAGTRQIMYEAGAGPTVTLNVVVTRADGCVFVGNKSVAVSEPDCTINSAPTVCASSVDNPASVPDAGPGATYTWDVSGGAIQTGQGTNAITFSVGVGAGVNISIHIVAAGGCDCSDTANLAVFISPNCTIGADSTVPSGSTGNDASVLNAGAGATYVWTITGGTITSGQGTDTITFTAGPPGTLTLGVTITNSGGCQCTGSWPISVF